MEIDQFVRAVDAELRKELNAKADSVASGMCTNYDSYKHLCGEIRGLHYARELINGLAKKVDDDE